MFETIIHLQMPIQITQSFIKQILQRTDKENFWKHDENRRKCW